MTERKHCRPLPVANEDLADLAFYVGVALAALETEVKRLTQQGQPHLEELTRLLKLHRELCQLKGEAKPLLCSSCYQAMSQDDQRGRQLREHYDHLHGKSADLERVIHQATKVTKGLALDLKFLTRHILQPTPKDAPSDIPETLEGLTYGLEELRRALEHLEQLTRAE